MKKLTAILLVAALLLGASTALAWECPGCGNENSGNFCTECGTRKPASNVCAACGTDHGDKTYTFCPNCGARMGAAAATATPAAAPVSTEAPSGQLEITGFVRNADGTHTVSWTDSGYGPYRVRYSVKLSDDYSADTSSPLNAGIYRAVKDYAETSYCVLSLVPGQDYWISVVDSASQEAVFAYDAPSLTNFPGFSTQMTLEPRSRLNDMPTALSVFYADEILAASDGTEYGLFVRLNYDTLTAEQETFAVFAVTDPNGVLITLDYGTLSFTAGEGYYRYWTFFSLDWYFEQMERLYDTIPAGEHTLWLYLDGGLATQAAFTVEEEELNCGIEFTQVTPNGDGTVDVAWTDSLNRGPYEVNYVQKLSDSFVADLEYADGVGEWTDESNVSGFTCTMDCLIPGVDYWIIVRDNTGWGTYEAYTAPDAQSFSEFTCTLSFQPETRSGETVRDVTGFSAAKLTQASEEYGGLLKISHPRLARDREYMMQLAITTPTGAIITENVTDIRLYSGGSKSIYWDFYDLDWYFGRVLANMNRIPTGTYTIDVYFDGLYACSTTFTVGE